MSDFLPDSDLNLSDNELVMHADAIGNDARTGSRNRPTLPQWPALSGKPKFLLGGAAALFLFVAMIAVVLLRTGDDAGVAVGGGDSEMLLLVSPFEDDETLFTAIAQDGTQLVFEGTRHPDGRFKKLEKLTIPGADVHYTVYFGDESLVSRVEGVSISTGESEAFDFSYSSESVTVGSFDSLEATIPFDIQTFSVQDIPGLRELLDQMSASNSPTGGSQLRVGDWMLAVNSVSLGAAVPRTDTDNVVIAASESVQITIEATVGTKSDQLVNLSDSSVRYVVKMPPEFLDCLFLHQAFNPGGTAGTMHIGQWRIASEERCRQIAAGHQATEAFERTGAMPRVSDGMYRKKVTLLRPLTEDQIEDICADAADAWTNADRALNVASVMPVVGVVFDVVSLVNSFRSGGARECITWGRTRESSLDQPWTTSARLLFGREKAWGECDLGNPDFLRSSDEKTFTARDLIQSDEVWMHHDIELDDLLDVTISGPARLGLDEEGVYTATAVGGAGVYDIYSYIFSWNPSPDQISASTEFESVAVFDARVLLAGSGYARKAVVAVSVEDAAGCEAEANLTVELTEEKVATGTFRPRLDPGSSIGANDITLLLPAHGGEVAGDWTLVIRMDLSARGYDCSFTQTTSGLLEGTYDGGSVLRGTTFLTGTISGVSGCENVNLENSSGPVDWSARFDGQRVSGSLGTIPFTAVVPAK